MRLLRCMQFVCLAASVSAASIRKLDTRSLSNGEACFSDTVIGKPKRHVGGGGVVYLQSESRLAHVFAVQQDKRGGCKGHTESSRVSSNGPLEAPDALVAWIRRRLTFAQSAYCIDGLANWTCATCDNSTVPVKQPGGPKASPRVTNITVFGNYGKGEFGFVALDRDSRTAVLAFRGTRTLNSWIKDLMVAKPDSPFPGSPEGARVHLGFLRAWESVREEAIAALRLLLIPSQNTSSSSADRDLHEAPAHDLLITGHSLGGAMSTLAAVDLIAALPIPASRISILTLNQPRTGNGIFSEWVVSHDYKNVFRIVNQNDLTPHLPPKFAGFMHHPVEIWIADANGHTFVCDVATIFAVSGHHVLGAPLTAAVAENDVCSNSIRSGFDIRKHGWIWDIHIGSHACRQS